MLRRGEASGYDRVGRAGLLLALILMSARARADEPPSLPPALAEGVEDRLRRLEEMNRRLLDELERRDARDREEDARRREEADQRYRDLEGRYEALRDRVERSERADPAEEGSRTPPSSGPSLAQHDETEEPGEPQGPLLRARLEEGFALETADEEYLLRFHVLDQTDFKLFVPNDQRPARSGLYIPRVRVYLEGRLTRPFEYEVSLQRSVDGVWDLLDGNLNYVPDERFQLKFGRQLTPYSFDWYDHLEQYFITPERALFPLNFGLSRQAGLLAHGYLGDGRLQYAFGGFDGRLQGLADNNKARDAVGYLNWRPFLLDEDRPWLRYLNVGGSIFGGLQVSAEEPLPMRTSLQSAENDEAASNASATFLDFREDARYFGERMGGAVHLAWYARGLSMEAELQGARFGMTRAGQPTRTLVPVTGGHLALSYFLTGEQPTRRTTVEPLRPFDRSRGLYGPGAIELFGRYSRLQLGQQVFDANLANEATWTRTADMTDIGFNWYLNSYIKFYFDWQHLFYGKAILLDPANGRFGRHGDLFWVRCQIYF